MKIFSLKTEKKNQPIQFSKTMYSDNIFANLTLIPNLTSNYTHSLATTAAAAVAALN